MIDPQLVAFTVVATIVTVIPGIDMALVARSVLTRGRRAGYITSVGICTGLWVHAVASALGLSAILMASATLFSAVKLAGALYLVAIGLTSLRRAFSPRGHAPAVAAGVTARDAGRAFVQGLLSNLLNPKVAMFYLSFFPQFLHPERGELLRQSLSLGAVQIGVSTGVNTVLICFAAAIAGFLNRNISWMRVQRYVMGTVLGLLALRLLTEKRAAA